MSQPRLIRFRKWGQSNQQGSAPCQAPTQARWDGGAVPTQQSRGTQALCTCLTPSYPQQAALLPAPGRVVEVLHGLHCRGKDQLPPCSVAAERDWQLKRCLWEVKDRRGGPKENGSSYPTFNWVPSPLSTSWKGPRGWNMGTVRLLGVPIWVSPCSGL